MGAILALTSVFATAACDIFPRTVPLDDSRVQAMLKAALSFDRAAYGFSPLPSSGHVRLEARPQPKYDAMLHFSDRTIRTIAFRKDSSGYRWIGEQETFQGPKVFKTEDGTYHEQVVLTFETEHISGAPLNQLSVTYDGEDARLANRRDLSLADVQPVLKQWGY